MSSTDSPEATPPPGRGRAAFNSRPFRHFAIGRFLGTVGWQMQSVVVAWWVFSLTNEPLDLGLVGLMHFLPAFLLALVTGNFADRYSRSLILTIGYLVTGICALVLAAMAYSGVHTIGAIFAVLVVIGTARAFSGPAGAALVPTLVPRADFSNAIAWNSSIWQAAMIAGPALGGIGYSRGGGPTVVFMVDAVLCLAAAAFVSRIRSPRGRLEKEPVTWHTVLAGLKYIWSRKALLGAISMDLFAVLLGGAVALLPVFAQDILKVGPDGLGILRSAPAVGAVTTALVLTHLPPLKRAGAMMLLCVGGFGFATIVFGLSTSFALSLVALVALGAFDMISVVVRHTLEQLLTPDDKRGRVSAVSQVFIGASNELGEFESGLTAHLFAMIPLVAAGGIVSRGSAESNGVVVAVIVGGCGTLVVVALWAWLFPDLRRFDRLDVHKLPEEVQEDGAVIRGGD